MTEPAPSAALLDRIAVEVDELPCGEHAVCGCRDNRPTSMLIRRRDVVSILRAEDDRA